MESIWSLPLGHAGTLEVPVLLPVVTVEVLLVSEQRSRSIFKLNAVNTWIAALHAEVKGW